jgi:hypothetical protein
MQEIETRDSTWGTLSWVICTFWAVGSGIPAEPLPRHPLEAPHHLAWLPSMEKSV